MSHDDTVVMDIVFQPPQVKSYSVDMCMVCDNCNVKHFSIKGKYYCEPYTGMRKFRIDQDFLIERWHTTYIMSKLFG